jgi:hypothetical protein
MRLILTCGALLGASVLLGYSAPAVPAHTLAYANRPATMLRVRNVSEKAIARHPRQTKMHVASPEVGDGKIIDHGSYSGTAPRKFEYVKPFSKEWDQRQAEEQRRINAAITICRSC